MLFRSRHKSLAIALLLALVSVTSAQSTSSSDDAVLVQYYTLLNDAQSNEAEAAVALFDHTIANAQLLNRYASTVIKYLGAASDSGNREASYRIGMLLEKGIWLEKSEKGATVFYLLSAQEGKPDAMYWCLTYFADKYRFGEQGLVEADPYKNAALWYEKIIESGEASPKIKREAKFVFGTVLFHEHIDSEEGWVMFGDAARSGHLGAIKFARKMYADAHLPKFEDEPVTKATLEHLEPIIADIGEGDDDN